MRAFEREMILWMKDSRLRFENAEGPASRCRKHRQSFPHYSVDD